MLYSILIIFIFLLLDLFKLAAIFLLLLFLLLLILRVTATAVDNFLLPVFAFNRLFLPCILFLNSSKSLEREYVRG